VGLFSRDKSGVTDNDRYRVLSLAKDEDYSLYEFASRLGEPQRLRLTVAELLEKRMVEVMVQRPDRERLTLNVEQAKNVLGHPSSWQEPVSGRDKFILIATDKGWRWHEKNWKPHD
jgi:dTDP-4-dehydrorhamnose reductase